LRGIVISRNLTVLIHIISYHYWFIGSHRLQFGRDLCKNMD